MMDGGMDGRRCGGGIAKNKIKTRRLLCCSGRRISFPFRGSIMDVFNAAQHAFAFSSYVAIRLALFGR